MVRRETRRRAALRVSGTEQEGGRILRHTGEKRGGVRSQESRHILFLPEAGKGEEGWEAARQKAVQVYALLLEGQDFGELAKKYSEDASGKDGGSLGSLKRGELAPDIEAAVLKLDAGQFSSPLRAQVGYHLFRLDAKE